MLVSTGTPAPGGRHPAARAVLESAQLTADQLPQRIRLRPDGTPFQPVQLALPATGQNMLPQLAAQLLREEPMRGWDGAFADNTRAILAVFPQVVSTYLEQARADEPLPPRLAALEQVLEQEIGQLRGDQVRQQAEYQRTCAALRHQQLAYSQPRRGLFGLVGFVFDSVRAVQLWNDREASALRLESVTAAYQILVTAQQQVRIAQSSLERLRETARVAGQTLHQERIARRQALAALPPVPLDWTPEYPVVAGLLAGQVPVQQEALRLLLAPPETLDAFLTQVRDEAAAAAGRLTRDLTLEQLLELVGQADGCDPDLDLLARLAQACLETGCYSRRIPRATNRQGRVVLIELTPDGQPIFGDAQAEVPIRSAPLGHAHEFGWLEFRSGLHPTDLLPVHDALAALDSYQATHGRNNALVPELVALPPPAGESFSANGTTPLALAAEAR